MSEMLDKLEINAESALDFDDTTLVVPMTLVREMFERLEAENAALKQYTAHKDYCPKEKRGHIRGGECTCGFDSLLIAEDTNE